MFWVPDLLRHTQLPSVVELASFEEPGFPWTKMPPSSGMNSIGGMSHGTCFWVHRARIALQAGKHIKFAVSLHNAVFFGSLAS